MAGDSDRGIRVFVSSTFKDMLPERDVLIAQTFPALRARLRERGIELCEIDLRWGITEEQSRRGETLPILFSEIDRCRPYFIGILGDRYGWIPSNDALTRDLVRAYPFLDDARGRSVTEMEIRYGALSSQQKTTDILFFERIPTADGAADEDADAHSRLIQLKSELRKSGFALQPYDTPASLGEAVETSLLALVERRFPSAALDDADRSERLHRSFAWERCRLHIGGKIYHDHIRKWLQRPGLPLLFTGASGGGKSALLATFAAAHRVDSPGDLIIEHYLGAAPDAADHIGFLRRLWWTFQRLLSDMPARPTNDRDLLDQLPELLAAANAVLEQSGRRVLIVLDGLDKLTSGSDLSWLPSFLPANIRLLSSSLPSRAHDAAVGRRWEIREVSPLTQTQRREMIGAILQKFGKTLTDDLAARVVAHTHSGTPLFLRTVLDELRRFGSFEQLAERVGYLLTASDVDQLFDRVLERLEHDHGAEAVSGASRLIWAARAGLEESEIVTAQALTPLEWSRLRNGFGDTLRDQDGRMFFDHDYLRNAVLKRYLSNAEQVRAAHLSLADHFAQLPAGLRRSEELPFQLGKAQAWPRLKTLLTDMSEFRGLRAHGDAELLQHWLLLAPQAAPPGPELLSAFLNVAGPGPWTRNHLALADEITNFLRFAGVRGPEVLSFAQLRAEQAEAQGVDADIMCAKAALANALFDERNYDEARRLQEEAIEATSRLHGTESRETLGQRAQLARMMRVRAFREAALRYRASMREAFGLAADTELGRTLSDEELEDRADQVLRQAIFAPNFVGLQPSAELLDAAAMEEKVFEDAGELYGESDPIALDSATALAEIHGLIGDTEAAKSLQEDVVEIRLRQSGSQHPDTLRAMETYVEILCALRFFDNARTAEESILERRRVTLGEGHPLTMKSKKLLADIRTFVDDNEAALELKREIISGHRADPNEAPPRPSVSSLPLGELLKGALLVALAGGLAWASYHTETIRVEGTRLVELLKSQMGID